MSKNKTIFLFLISIYLIFAPNLLISVTSKYVDWVVNKGSVHYLTSFFSFYGIVLLLGLTTIFITNKISNRILKIFFILSTSIFLATMGFVTDYSNQQIANQQSQVTITRKLIESFLNSSYFNQIKNNSTIISPDMFASHNILVIPNNYWQDYIKAKKNKEIKFLSSFEKATSPEYFVRIILTNSSYYLFVAEISKKSNEYNLSTNKVYVFGISDSDHINLQAEFTDKTALSKSMSINGNSRVISDSFLNVNENINSLSLKTVPVVISLNTPIYIDSIRIYPTEFNYSGEYDISFNEECYSKESDGSNYWVWCKKNSKVNIINKTDNDLSVEFISQIKSCNNKSLLKFGSSLQPINNETENNFKLLLHPGKNTIPLELIGAQSCSVENDKRDLWIKYSNFYIDNNG